MPSAHLTSTIWKWPRPSCRPPWKRQSPVILQASQGAIKYAGLEMITAMAKVLADGAAVPVVLHLDHGTDYKQNVKCLRAGFTSLMFDGHELPLEQNIAMTAKIVDIAHSVGLPVEAEIGSVLTIESLLTDAEIAEIRALEIPKQFEVLRKKIGPMVEEHIAKPEEAKRFVTETGVDFLAAAVGSVHGLWLDIWPLRVDRLKEIYRGHRHPHRQPWFLRRAHRPCTGGGQRGGTGAR